MACDSMPDTIRIPGLAGILDQFRARLFPKGGTILPWLLLEAVFANDEQTCDLFATCWNGVMDEKGTGYFSVEKMEALNDAAV
jgi:hypothetical protein